MARATESAPERRRFLLDSGRFVGILFLAPAVLYIILLVGFPFMFAIGFSLSDVTVGNTSLNYNGFENFIRAWRNPVFRTVLANTFYFTFVSQVFILIFANILAVIYTQNFTGKWFARFLFILPWATPVSLAMIGWLWLFDPQYSSIDYVLLQLGLLGRDGVWGPNRSLYWLANPSLAQVSVIFVQVWRFTPLATVILMAGLSSIPSDILDQAEVDGSRFLRTLFQVKLPLILPIMIISMLFSVITMFGDMTVYYVLTRGGPVNYTRVVGLYSFQVGIEGGSLGEGAAIALFAFPLMLAFAIIMLRIASRAEVQ